MFIFSADWHLSKLTWTDRPEIVGDSYNSVTQIVDLALRLRAPLFAAGDLFDKRSPDTESVVFMCRQMDRLQAADIPLYYIQGQHELRTPPWLSVHHWPTHLHQRSVVIDGLRIYGLDWTPRGELQRQLDQVPADTDVLLCHQVWTELMGGVGQQDGAISDVSFARFVLTGDYHKTLVRSCEGKTGPVQLYSPGSVSVRKIDEPVDKHVFVCSVDADRNVCGVASGLVTRSFLSWSASTVEELDARCAAARQLPEQDPDSRPVVRLTYLDSLPDVLSRFTAATENRLHVFYNLVSRPEEIVAVNMSQVTDDQVESLVEAVGLLSSGTDVASDAQTLITAPDQKSCWESLFNAFMQEPSSAQVTDVRNQS